MPNKRLFSEEVEAKICEAYESGSTCTTIAKQRGGNHQTILNILRRNGVIIRRRGYANKYQINQDFFREIETEEQAYFLGFMFADGYVNKDYGSIMIALHKKDRDALEQFLECLGSTAPLKVYPGQPNAVRLGIANRALATDLISWGCIQRKSLVLRFPERLSLQWYPHFIRGYFDGDGSISTRTAGNGAVFALSSTAEFLEIVRETFLRELGVKSRIRKDGPIHRLTIHTWRDIVKVLDYLYEDAHFYLSRKHRKAQEIKSLSVRDYSSRRKLK